jgi:prepilin-type N-terminal cleavage/methylation domain-containing protein
MKKTLATHARRTEKADGFTLLEFLVAMAVFLTVTGAVFSLLRKDDPLFNQQQNMVGVNLSLQNAVTQLQMDGVNAGTGYYAGANVPNWPVGITIQNPSPTAGTCGDNATFTYGSTCFDTLNIISVDPNTLPQHLGAAAGCAATYSGGGASSTMVLYTPGSTSGQASALAAKYVSGDELLLVKVDGSQMTTVALTANGSSAGSVVTLAFKTTNSDGTNTAANDFLGITTNTGAADNPHTQLGTSFCNSDWILRLQPITYKVDASVSTDPKLVRVQGGATNVIAEQVIGFRVGASLWNDTHDTDLATSTIAAACAGSSDSTSGSTTYYSYNYNACSYGAGNGASYDYSIIRSIRVSIIGRTPPNSAGNAITFRNSFDSGPYQIQGLSVVINPRNLSMTD